MLFFVLLVIADIVVSALMIWLILTSARRSLSYRVKRPIFYLTPVFATILLLVYTVLFSAPRLLDVQNMIVSPVPERTVTVEKLGRWNAVVSDGRKAYLSPWSDTPEVGGVYQARITENGRIVIQLEPFSGNLSD